MDIDLLISYSVSLATNPHVFSIPLLAVYPGIGVKGKREIGRRDQKNNKNEEKR